MADASPSWHPTVSDVGWAVCFVCARKEEALAVEEVVRDRGGIREVVLGGGGLSLVAYNIEVPKLVRVYVTYAFEQGGDFTHDWMAQLDKAKPWIDDRAPELFLMTGVCAGERGKCDLGDIMVASRAYNYEFGKRAINFSSEVIPFKPNDMFVRWVETAMADDSSWHEYASDKFPPTVCHVDLYERYLFARGILDDESSGEEICATERAWLGDNRLPESGALLPAAVRDRFNDPTHGSAVSEARRRGDVVKVDGKIVLTDSRRSFIAECIDIYDEFPSVLKLPPQKPATFGTWGSGASVRADTSSGGPLLFRGSIVGELRMSKVFTEVQRGTVAVDMEASAFYQHLMSAEHPAYLVVKAVCDYADDRKCDSYHRYGKHAAAAYALRVVSNWTALPPRTATSSRGPTVGGE
jgi:hypothetical protein